MKMPGRTVHKSLEAVGPQPFGLGGSATKALKPGNVVCCTSPPYATAIEESRLKVCAPYQRNRGYSAASDSVGQGPSRYEDRFNRAWSMGHIYSTSINTHKHTNTPNNNIKI